MSARTVVTGVGVLAPNGGSADEYWSALLRGESGIAPLQRYDAARFPARLAGQISDFDAAGQLPSRLLPQTDRVTRLALVAADRALADADVRPADLGEYDMGVITSNASGGFEFTHVEIQKLWTKGPQYVSVYESFAWFYAVNTGQISIRHGMRGPGGVLVGEQAGGLDALGHARRNVRKGIRLVVSGGIESSLDPWGYVSHLSNPRASRHGDPCRAYLPFDTAACGYVPGEGGAILICEDEASARERGGRIYGALSGYAATFDPPPGSERPPGLRRAAEEAIADAALIPADIDVVFADASGTLELDAAEADAITAIFGPDGVPVTAPKTMTGRLYAGGGPLDVATALLSIRDGVLPPTANVRDVPAAYRIDLVREPRPQPVRHALVLARGHGGFNAAVVVSATDQ